MNIFVSKNLYDLAKIFGENSPLFIVGGYVRNSLLGIADTDIDVASALTISQIKELINPYGYKITIKSEKMGTIIISKDNEEYEHTTFRNEVYTTNKHQPDFVNFGASILDDARRRDFSANCIYYQILTEEIIDFYGGVTDTNSKILCAIESPDYVFNNDGLRILRMIRLSGELDFKIESNTFLGAKQNLEHLKNISGERKFKELEKMFVSSTRYSFSPSNASTICLQLVNDLNGWSYMINFDKVSIDLNQINPSKNALLFFVQIYPFLAPQLITKNLYIEYSHRTLGKKALNCSNDTQKLLIALLDVFYSKNIKFSLIKQYKYIEKILDICRENSPKKYKQIIKIQNRLIKTKTPLTLSQLNIDGNILMKQTSIDNKHYSIILNYLFWLTVKFPILNKTNILLKLAKQKEKKLCSTY